MLITSITVLICCHLIYVYCTVDQKYSYFPEPVIYFRRMVANPYIVKEMGESHKPLAVSGIGGLYFKQMKLKEAAPYIKRTIEANIMSQPDTYRFFLAVCNLAIGKYEESAEALSILYRQRVFDIDFETLHGCFKLEHACLRECIHDILKKITNQYTGRGMATAAQVERLKMEHPDKNWSKYTSLYVYICILLYVFYLLLLLYFLHR